jgi:hypothetical protein
MIKEEGFGEAWIVEPRWRAQHSGHNAGRGEIPHRTHD